MAGQKNKLLEQILFLYLLGISCWHFLHQFTFLLQQNFPNGKYLLTESCKNIIKDQSKNIYFLDKIIAMAKKMLELYLNVIFKKSNWRLSFFGFTCRFPSTRGIHFYFPINNTDDDAKPHQQLILGWSGISIEYINISGKYRRIKWFCIDDA